MKKALAATMTMMAAGAVSVAALSGSASAQVCAVETYSWNNTSITTMGTWNPTFTTGVTIPGPVGGERLSIASASWTAYDRLMEEDSDVTRENPEENGERFTIRIGGSQVGSPSADLPDTAAEGAPTPWFSGVISGSFGGVGTSVSGGAITLHHAGSGTGVDAFNPKSITISIERCTPVVTTTAAPTTTLVASGGPTTTVAAGTPTTTASPTAPTTPATPTTPTTPTGPASPGTPTTTIVGSGGPTPTVPGGSLPVTGGDMTLPLILAALAAGTGTVLLMVRRRAGTN